MKWSKALIWATIWSYFAAAVAALGGSPAMEGIPAPYQAIFYTLMGIILYAQLHYENNTLAIILTALYGFLAMLSFSGVQQWINYYGTTSLGPWMALWDLALAVALADDF